MSPNNFLGLIISSVSQILAQPQPDRLPTFQIYGQLATGLKKPVKIGFFLSKFIYTTFSRNP